MREILFRGKRIDDGKWLYGLYSDERVHDTDFPCIMPLEEIIDDGNWEVSPETVGQYTGLTDKNGKKIFEGDILKVDKMRHLATVVFDIEECQFAYKSIKTEMRYGMGIGGQEEFDVIGNICDNPELLEGGAE